LRTDKEYVKKLKACKPGLESDQPMGPPVLSQSRLASFSRTKGVDPNSKRNLESRGKENAGGQKPVIKEVSVRGQSSNLTLSTYRRFKLRPSSCKVTRSMKY